jgi:predicted RNA methylase
MKLKQLESLLEDVESFAAPKISLEQYATGAHLAARILHTAHALGDVEGRTVVDLGCGCGVLSIAAALMSAGHVVRRDPCRMQRLRDWRRLADARS